MNSKNDDIRFSILFTSIIEYKSKVENEALLNTLKQSDEIKKQQDLLNSYTEEDVYSDSIGFTKA